jgi:tetratricopeptide (TPR) repeat protein
MNDSKKALRALVLANALAFFLIPRPALFGAQTDAPLAQSLDAARRTRDESQLRSIKTQIEQRLRQNSEDALTQYHLAQVQGYLADVYEGRKDNRSASKAIDEAIEAAQRSLQLFEKSADVHSLLGDLYGRKISLGTPMFAGPKYGPRVDEENKRAMALDDKNPRVWASLGRQCLMTPKMFGGDIPKAIDSFQKSLALDASQDETWVWLAKAYQKQGDKPKAREAVQHALELDPDSAFANEISFSLRK